MNKKPESHFLKCNQFLVDWSPKAGCTIAKKIWFDHMKVLDQALDHEVVRYGMVIKGWVHDFTEIFHQKFGYATEFNFSSDDFIKLKYVRNPWNRAVSSYIHACKFPNLFENYQNKNPSFYEFLSALLTQKLCMYAGGTHWRIQNIFPHLKYDEIIKIENLESETEKLNKKYKLNLRCNFSSDHHVIKQNKIDNFFNTSASDVKKYLDENKQIPKYDSFYNEELINMVYQIYKTDIETYDYTPPY